MPPGGFRQCGIAGHDQDLFTVVWSLGQDPAERVGHERAPPELQVAFQSHLFYPAWSDNSDSTGTNPNGKLHQVDLYAALVRIP